MTTIKQDAETIIQQVIHSSLPDTAVKNELKKIDLGNGNVYVVSIGKAGWTMDSPYDGSCRCSILLDLCILVQGHANDIQSCMDVLNISVMGQCLLYSN